MLMADVRIDDRDLRLVIGALTELLGDGYFELTGSERQAYERLCKLVGHRPVQQFEQRSLGLLREDEPPHPDEPQPTGRGVMADYIERTRHFLGGGVPWSPPHEPQPDVAKQIADKMARASHDAATGKTTPAPQPDKPKRALTDEERRALREALGDE